MAFTAKGKSRSTFSGNTCPFGLTVRSIPSKPIPDNALGKAATQFLRKHWLSTEHVIYGDKMIGKYFLEKGAVHRSSEVIYEREGSSFSLIEPDMIDWEHVLKDADWFHFTGITPAISEGAANCCLNAIKTANKMGIMVSGDINSRDNMWKYGKSMQEVMPELVENCDVVITSSRGIHEMFGLGEPGDKYRDSARKLMERFPKIQKVVGKKRESISASHQQIQGKMWNGTEYIKSENLNITHVIDRVARAMPLPQDLYTDSYTTKMIWKP